MQESGKDDKAGNIVALSGEDKHDESSVVPVTIEAVEHDFDAVAS